MLTARHKLDFKTGKRSAKKIAEADRSQAAQPSGRFPRITKMMALAIRLDHLIKTRQVTDQAELARVGRVSRARLTQIMDLNLLAPDIQEAILFHDKTERGPDYATEREVRSIAATHSWKEQRRMWNAIKST